MKIAIIGSGSIGMLTTFYLAEKGLNPVLVTKREEQAAIINNKGIHIKYQNDEKNSIHVHARSISSVSELGPIDVAIIAVKSHQVKKVLLNIEKVKVNAILFLQNGMGHTELFSHLTIPEIGVAVVEHGTLRTGDYSVRHTGIGQLRWSYVKKGNHHIRTLLANGQNPLFNVNYEENWSEMLQSKLIVNACINPLTALLRVKNGELIANEHSLHMIRTVFNEVIDVLGVSHKEELWGQVCLVCENTAENRSSMLVDIEHNRQTEIDSILGFLINKAKQQNKEATMLTFLYHGIKSLENG